MTKNPFECKYCYTRGGEVGLSKINAEKILLQLQNFADSTAFETIQFGYEGDPFARPELGPLYADDRGQFVRFNSPEILETVPNRKDVVSWSAHSPIWKRYEDETRLRQLTAMIEGKGGNVFLSSADAMAIVSQKRSGTLPGPLKG